MRSLTRPIATAGSTVLLVLALAACGDDDGGERGNADDASQGQESPGAESSGSVTAPTQSATGGPVDASTKAFCEGLQGVNEIAGSAPSGIPTADQWEEIQQAYADLGDIGAPEAATARQREGLEIIVDAITGLSYADAKREFRDTSGSSIPGVSPQEEKKAAEFFDYVGPACADALQ